MRTAAGSEPPRAEFEIDSELLGAVLAIGAGGERPALPRHRHDLSREQVESAQRARIIVATAEVVTERGYAGASVKEIIARAGVSSKTFYTLYDDKESAFFAAYTLLDGVVVGVVRSPLSLERPRDIVRGGVRAFLETLARWPLFTRMHAVEARAAGPRVLERRILVYRELVAALAAAFAAAREADDRITVPSEPILMALVGGIGELVLQRIVEEGVEALPELAPTIVELVERIAFSEIPDY